jgi:predicted DNA-binding transcriptional regulator AlpA
MQRDNNPHKKYLPARLVWERYGVTSQSLYRWLHDQEMAFPRPIYIGRNRYWVEDDLTTWERQRATEAA